MTTLTYAPPAAVAASMCDDEVGARVLGLAADVESYVHRRLRTAGSTAVVRDELGDLASATSEVVGDVVEILWTKRDQWTTLCDEDQRRWTFAVARNIVARRVKKAYATRVHRSEFVPLLDGTGEPTVVDPRLDTLAELRLLVESRLGDVAWATITAAIQRNHSPHLRADVAAALEAVAAGRVPSTRAIVRRCRVDWRPWALARLEAGQALRPPDAVDLGLFATLVEATSTLTRWWVEQRTAFDQPIDDAALVASGLIEHFGRTEAARREAASDLLVWISTTGTRAAVAA
ncbi:hypothetical protein MWU57_08200 [Isoptericola sp. S6320L]|uniref:hypothetical protein n=1 Tax=Isoptericola sp. S6320L TaxID=2926411 RepID=UPI001FF5D7FA|nr:hypothetical protein [Isoptericola sp. S6320L]MCK0117016.1 hypothetical protein [Isoptericola sp. S6320L]